MPSLHRAPKLALPIFLALLALPTMRAQVAPVDPAPVPPPEDKHAFGVLPNYRTTELSNTFSPITTKQKFTIAVKDSFDGPGFILAGVLSGLSQLDNQNPSFGQGIKGYAHRYVTSYADQVSGNMMTEAIFPTLLHEDPRYFRRGEGSKTKRLFYAITRVLVTRNDSGSFGFNFSEVLGNAVTASISNAYYPDNRGFGDTMERTGTQIGTDALSNVLKEFWPDVKKHFFHKNTTPQS